MQLYALDNTGKKYNVHSAQKGIDYFCLECGARVRVRSSELLRAHFYHIYDIEGCRQAGKTLAHIAIQRLIGQQIGIQNCIEEMRFGSIGRVADVAWQDKKLIFEVQCSPISAQEIEERNRDYASCGWDVVWILYDKTFNQKRPSKAENYLRYHTHYYSDSVQIYDCYKEHNQISRSYGHLSYFDTCTIDLCTIKLLSFERTVSSLPGSLHTRFCSWAYFSEGDYLWLALHDDDNAKIGAIKRATPQKAYFNYGFQRLKNAFKAVWHVILERSCS